MKLVADLTKANLILVRHGESASNAGGRTNKNEEIPLTDKGHEQALATAKLLSERVPTPSVIYSSPFLRAFQTAKPYSKLVGIPITLETNWHEINYLDPVIVGNSTYAERKKFRDDFWAKSQTDTNYHAPSLSSKSQPESLNEFIARIDFAFASIRDIMANTNNPKVVVYTHEFVISTVIDLVAGYSKQEIANRMLQNNGPANKIANGQTIGFHSQTN